jgi:hypothetical protein
VCTAVPTTLVGRLLLAFACGAIGGAALDQMHVGGHVLAYERIDFAQQPWWVAPQFGAGAVLVLLAAFPLARREAGPLAVPLPPASTVGADAGWFLGAYLATALFDPYPRVLAGVLLVTWIARVSRGPNRTGRAAFAVVLATAGTLYEGTLAGSGAFTYLRSDAYNVPVWLPGLYLHGAALAVVASRLLLTDLERPAPTRGGAPTRRGRSRRSAA